MSDDTVTIHTVGHSNRAIGELLQLLRDAGILCLVDVRAIPGSKRHPQFTQDNLRAALEAAGIVYHWAGRQLGGLREENPVSRHTAIADAGLRAFADHMESEGFHRGVAQLVQLARRAPVAIMCAEKLPHDCHRNLIADYLVAKGFRVRHLVEPGVFDDHRLNAAARIEAGNVIYDGIAQQTVKLNS